MNLPEKMPELGDPSKVFYVELTEPEINCLYALIAFIGGCRLPNGLGPFADYVNRWHEHYGPTMKSLDEKLSKYDGM